MRTINVNRPVFYFAVLLATAGTFAVSVAAGYRYDSRGRRDPFVPLVGVSERSAHGGVRGILSAADVSLQGIVTNEDGRKQAVINGELMKEGDRIGRLLVESIGENSVKVKIDEAEFEIKLYK